MEVENVRVTGVGREGIRMMRRMGREEAEGGRERVR